MTEVDRKMLSFIVQSMHNERGCYFISGLLLLIYILIMDILLYCALQNQTLVSPSKEGMYSPFHPLSVKLLMSDPIQHYILSPTSEYFEEFFNFSKHFHFITPNMISFFHLFLALVSAKFVSSDSLKHRRIGVILYQVRTWLDGLDGVVYRSRKNEKHLYQSHHESWGYIIDSFCDITGGVILSFGVLFYLFRQPPSFYSKYKEESSATLPLTKTENGYSSGEKISCKPSKKMLFWKCFCWGMQIFVCSGTWDKRVDQYTKVYAVQMHTTQQQMLQTSSLHSMGTWLVMYVWRYVDGQSLLNIYCIAIFMDKIWEFLNLVQYIGFAFVLFINIVSEVHLRHVKEYIGI